MRTVFLTRTGLLFAALVLSACCIEAFQPPLASSPKTAAMEQGLRGHVKSVRVDESDRDGDSRTLAERSIFGRDGRMLEYAHVTGAPPYPVEYQVIRYIYDPRGRTQGEDMLEVSSLR